MHHHFGTPLIFVALFFWHHAEGATSVSAASTAASNPLPSASASGSLSPNSFCGLESSAIALLREQLAATNRTPSWSAPSAVTSASLAVIALASLSFSLYQFNRGRADNDGWKNKEIRAARRLKLLEALLWFESPLHQRSAALAVVEGHWEEYPELHTTWAAVLVANSVEIVLKADTSLAARDQRDFQRMLELLNLYAAKGARATSEERIMDTIAAALDELPTRVVVSSTGDHLTPNRRQRFIAEIMAVADQYPHVCAKNQQAAK